MIQNLRKFQFLQDKFFISIAVFEEVPRFFANRRIGRNIVKSQNFKSSFSRTPQFPSFDFVVPDDDLGTSINDVTQI